MPSRPGRRLEQSKPRHWRSTLRLRFLRCFLNGLILRKHLLAVCQPLPTDMALAFYVVGGGLPRSLGGSSPTDPDYKAVVQSVSHFKAQESLDAAVANEGDLVHFQGNAHADAHAKLGAWIHCLDHLALAEYEGAYAKAKRTAIAPCRAVRSRSGQ